MDTIIETFWTFLFNTIVSFITTIVGLPSTLIIELLDNLVINEYVQSFYLVINTYVLPYVGFFANLVPPTTWSLIVFYISFLISLYGIVLVSHYVLKVLKLIKKVPLA